MNSSGYLGDFWGGFLHQYYQEKSNIRRARLEKEQASTADQTGFVEVYQLGFVQPTALTQMAQILRWLI